MFEEIENEKSYTNIGKIKFKKYKNMYEIYQSGILQVIRQTEY